MNIHEEAALRASFIQTFFSALLPPPSISGTKQFECSTDQEGSSLGSIP